MTTFAELTKRVHSINDLILSDMVSKQLRGSRKLPMQQDVRVAPYNMYIFLVRKDYTEEMIEFRSRVLVTMNWFSRISWANKKRFVLALLGDVKSVWTLSLLLKSIWNCRPKDAVLSVSQSHIWSSYDQVPMDHNRTALPLSTLKEVMTKDRKWFMYLESESQAILLSELLTISGGPIMWEVLQRAQTIYEQYLERELKDIQECNVVTEPVVEKVKPAPESVKKESTPRKVSVGQAETGRPLPGQAQKELDANLAAWNANIKSMRDRMKLEELQMVFNDGSMKKVWKVNRPKPETTETVDFIQLLPSEIGKRILKDLPTAQLPDCARVNKYWSYLVDELKSELTIRQKINVELEKLKDNMLKHDASLDLLTRPEFQIHENSSPATGTEWSRRTKTQASTRLSMKTNALSFRQAPKKTGIPFRMPQKPINNLMELTERLQRRGAADENIWKWCENVLSDNKEISGEECKKETEGLLSMENTGFPCPLMKHNLNVPLKLPLLKDPVESAPVKTTINMFRSDRENSVKQDNKRYTLWSRDMSGLYPVCKLPSYQFPF